MTSAFLYSIPHRAPIPFATVIATGVASPKEHGQVMTSTATALSKEKEKGFPAIIQMIKEIIAIPMTEGTSIADILSAILATGAFVAAASFAAFTIEARAVSLPVFSALHFKKPERFIEAVKTVEPSSFSHGMLSPVKADSSAELIPSRTTPSAGNFSPGLTTKISPGFISSAGMTVSAPSTITVAFPGASLASDSKASVVFPFALASSILPIETNTRIIAADSK